MAEDSQRIFLVGIMGPGGSRCITQPLLLNSIEKKTKIHASDFFDMTVSVSGGMITQGILNLSDKADPTKPRFWSSDSVTLYDELTPHVFPKTGAFSKFNMYAGRGKYDSGIFAKELDTIAGDTRLCESRTNTMALVATTNRERKATWPSHVKGRPDLSKAAWGTARIKDLILGGTTVPILHQGRTIETYPKNGPPLKHRIVDGYSFLGSLLEKTYMDAEMIAPPGAKIVIAFFGTGITYPLHDRPVGLSSGTLDMLAHLSANAPLHEALRLQKKKLGDALMIFDAVIDQQKRKDDPFSDLDNGSKDQNRRLKAFARRIEDEQGHELDRFARIIERRAFIEDKYQRSRTPFGQLHAMIERAETPHDIAELRASLAGYILDRDALPKAGEEAVWRLYRELNPEHAQNIQKLAETRLDFLREKSLVAVVGKQIMQEVAGAARDVTAGIASAARGIREAAGAAKDILIEPFRGENPRTDGPRDLAAMPEGTYSLEDRLGYTADPRALLPVSTSFNRRAPVPRAANSNAVDRPDGDKPPVTPTPVVKQAG